MLARSFVTLCGALVAAPPPQAHSTGPVPPRTVTLKPAAPDVAGDVLAAVRGQTGLDVTPPPNPSVRVAGGFDGVPAWRAVERVAEATGTRLDVRDRGRKLALVPGRPEPSSVDGPFRVVARQVTARTDLAAGRTYYDVELEAHWEPRLPVFRADSRPTVTAAADDRGAPLTAAPGGSRGFAGGVSSYPLTVRLDGLTRQSKSVARLDGSFVVTASERMIPFTFDAGEKLPATRQEDGVTVVLKSFGKDAGTGVWGVELEATYPPGGPTFDSFEEEWRLSENRLRLVSPDRKTTLAPTEVGYESVGRVVEVRYGFRELPAGVGKGWTLVYETPAPLREYPVRFALKDIPLP